MVRVVPLLSSLAFPFVESSYTSPDCVSVFPFFVLGLRFLVFGSGLSVDIRYSISRSAPFHSGDPIR